MINKTFKIIIEKDKSGFYVADVPELEGCHTQAKTKEQLIKRVKEVIELCLEDKPKIKSVDIRTVKVPLRTPLTA